MVQYQQGIGGYHMTIAERPLTELVQQLPPDIAIEVRHYIEYLLERQRKVRGVATDPATRGWPAGFFEATAGSIPDFPAINRDGDGIDPRLDEVVLCEYPTEPSS
jgi:Protein of unknown function (DUF2281)